MTRWTSEKQSKRPVSGNRVRDLPLELSGLEVVFLTDAIRNPDRAEGLEDEEAYLPLAREVLLLLGTAYCELVTDAGIVAGPVLVRVTEEQAWLLRSKVKTGDLAIDGKTMLGVGLLKKLYGLLRAFNETPAAISMLRDDAGMAFAPVVRLTEPPVEEVKEDASGTTSDDPGAGKNADPGNDPELYF